MGFLSVIRRWALRDKMPIREIARRTGLSRTARHRPAWSHSADEARMLLKEKRLSPLQRTILRQDLERIEGILDNIDRDTKNALGQ